MNPWNKSCEFIARKALHSVSPFFRSYPYSGSCKITNLNIRGAFSPTDRFFYNRIPKAANTTIINLLANHSGFRQGRGGSPKSRFLRPIQMRRKHVSDLQSGNVFRFIFVRNPYSRVLSAYQDKFMHERCQLKRYSRFMECGEGGIPSFTEFVRFLNNGGLFCDAHWAPQTHLTLIPVEDFDHIAHVETIDSDIPLILNRIWGIQETAAPEFKGRRTNAHEAMAVEYTEETREIVARLYADDFSVFGYDSANWGNLCER